MTASLIALRLTAFRGACEPFALPFDPKKKLTVIYGENGTGKTTICDAFEFLAKGDVGSLQDRGIGAGLHKYWPSASKQPGDVRVELEDGAGSTFVGTIIGKNAHIVPAGSRPQLQLMRRKQMLALVEARAGERYEAIRHFIDIGLFEQSETNLKKHIGELEADKVRAETAELETYISLSDLSAGAGNPQGTNPIVWAEALVAEPEGNEAAEQTAIDTLIVQFTALFAYPDLHSERQAVETAAKTNHNTAVENMNTAAASAAANANEIVAILKAGEAYLHAYPDSEVCPLCESPDRAAGLAERITSRLQQFNAVSEAKIELDKCAETLSTAKANLTLLLSGHAENLEGYKTARTGFEWDAKYSFPETSPPAAITDLLAWLNANKDLLEKWKDIEASLRSIKERRGNAKRALDRYSHNTAEKARLVRLIPKLEQAHTLVKTKRQEFTDTIINEIAEKVGELYEIVHPGEGKDKIVLALDHAKRASIDLNAQFGGVDAPPQAYFSQSHLDTLGLCIFLALALREKPKDTILILDDVLGSVDEPHVDRVIAMICNVTKEFRHTIITTHYGPWRHKYRWGLIKGGHPCQFVELTGSGLDGVIRAVGSIPEIDRLRIMVAADQPDLQAVVGKAGVVLEAVLTFMANCYGPRLPFRASGKHTLGELLPNIKGKLRDALRIEIVEKGSDGEVVKDNIAFKALLDDIFAQGSIRNEVGAHFNTDAFDVPDAKALTYAGHVLRLAEAMICPDHGWPSSDKSGSHWSNAGGTRRMHPLREPK
jgi:AAA domain